MKELRHFYQETILTLTIDLIRWMNKKMKIKTIQNLIIVQNNNNNKQCKEKTILCRHYSNPMI